MRKQLTAVLLAALAAVATGAATPAAAQEPEWQEEVRRAVEQAQAAAREVEKQAGAVLQARQEEIRRALAEAQMAMKEAQKHTRLALQSHREELHRVLAEAHLSAQQAREHVEREVRAHGPEIIFSGSEGGWLGVSIQEVTPEKARELKLTPVRGVHIADVDADSPAAKAGLMAGDVVIEFNGQSVVGAVQFRRLVRETPAGRSVELTVWRGGRAQPLSVTLGSHRERMERRVRVFSGPEIDFDFDLRLPEIFVAGGTPLLGVSVDDVSGQLGAFFGVPDGKGVLVREVRAGSPAEKAGIKAGDVVVRVDGERVITAGELRIKLRAKREGGTVRLGVIRNRAETAVQVELEPPRSRDRTPAPSRRTVL